MNKIVLCCAIEFGLFKKINGFNQINLHTPVILFNKSKILFTSSVKKLKTDLKNEPRKSNGSIRIFKELIKEAMIFAIEQRQCNW